MSRSSLPVLALLLLPLPALRAEEQPADVPKGEATYTVLSIRYTER